MTAPNLYDVLIAYANLDECFDFYEMKSSRAYVQFYSTL
jgi:hypothetical protein